MEYGNGVECTTRREEGEPVNEEDSVGNSEPRASDSFERRIDPSYEKDDGGNDSGLRHLMSGDGDDCVYKDSNACNGLDKAQDRKTDCSPSVFLGWYIGGNGFR